jgi:hypothetical protein
MPYVNSFVLKVKNNIASCFKDFELKKIKMAAESKIAAQTFFFQFKISKRTILEKKIYFFFTTNTAFIKQFISKFSKWWINQNGDFLQIFNLIVFLLYLCPITFTPIEFLWYKNKINVAKHKNSKWRPNSTWTLNCFYCFKLVNYCYTSFRLIKFGLLSRDSRKNFFLKNSKWPKNSIWQIFVLQKKFFCTSLEIVIIFILIQKFDLSTRRFVSLKHLRYIDVRISVSSTHNCLSSDNTQFITLITRTVE